MQTAKALVQNPAMDDSVEARALFDCGSQRSYITEALATQLKLSPIEEESLTLCTFGTKDITSFPSRTVDLEVRTVHNKSIRIRVNTTPCITHDLKREILPSSIDRAQFNSVQLADDYFSEESEYSIDILIGNDYYFKFMLQERRVVREGLYLINTRLGWMLTGRVESDGSNGPVLAELTFALTNFVGIHFRAESLPTRESFLLKSSENIRVFQKQDESLIPPSEFDSTSRKTSCATVSEISLPEESVSDLRSTERVMLAPVLTTSVPMIEPTSVQIEVKFLNGIRTRSSRPLSTLSRYEFDYQ